MHFNAAIIYIIVLFFDVHSTDVENPCETRDGSIGRCVNVQECDGVLNKLRIPASARITQDEILQKIRRVKCGHNDRDQRICCPRENKEQKTDNENLTEKMSSTGLKVTSFGREDGVPQNANKTEPGVRPITTNGGFRSVHDKKQGFQFPLTASKPSNSLNFQAANNNNPFLTNNRKTEKDSEKAKNKVKLLSDNCGKSIQYKYFSGNATDLDDFPWIALLEYQTPQGKRKGCGGVLINDRYILTAAHCVTKLPPQWRVARVHLGKHNIDGNRDCAEDSDDGAPDDAICSEPKVVPVQDRIVHPMYSERLGYRLNDIALLRLATPISFTPYVEPICLPFKTPIGQLYLASGWGKTLYNSGYDQKRVSKMKMQNNQVCAKSGVRLSKYQFCVNSTLAQDTCIPDEGGPLMGVEAIDDGSHRTAVFGILSYIGQPTDFYCSANNLPAVYTGVLEYVPWILKRIEE